MANLISADEIMFDAFEPKMKARYIMYIEGIPSMLLKKAVCGMLPKNRLGRLLASNLRVYDDDKHPHTAQSPEVVSI